MMIINSYSLMQDTPKTEILAKKEIEEILECDQVCAVLIALYEFRYGVQEESNVQTLIELKGLEQEAVWQAINLLEEAHWVTMWNIEGKYTITGIGATNLERFSVVPQDIALRSQAARDWLINKLIKNYSSTHRGNPATRSTLYDSNEMIDNDIDIAIGDCSDLGLVKVKADSIRMLQSGFHYYKERERWKEISDHFKQLHDCSTPQKRGGKISKAFLTTYRDG